MKIVVFLLCCLSSLNLYAQEIYTLLTPGGEKVSLNSLTAEAIKRDVILFGELHNQPVVHWLQLRLVKELPAKTAVGFEMFDIDNRQLLKDYSAGLATERHLSQAMAVWSNFKQDYLPIVQAAQERGLPVFASNAPTRLVTYTAKKGLDSLALLKASHPLLAFPLPTEQDLSNELYSFIKEQMPPGHNSSGMIAAQALRDASMAYYIKQELLTSSKVLHIHGGFHSKNRNGISHFLEKYGVAKNRIFHIQTVIKKDCALIDEATLAEAELTVCLPEDSITSY